MSEVMEIDEKAKHLGIEYQKELAKENVFERFFS